MTDKDFLKIAIKEGKKGAPPHLYGAVVVKDGKIVAQDHNHVWEQHDPSAHAEVSTLRLASEKLGSYNIPGCTLYASHEPCLMCFMCAVWAEVDRVVFAIPAADSDPSSYGFKDLGILEINNRLLKPILVEQVGANWGEL